ncbi:unnamed protein product [Rotaria sordida]|uniref:G-protein coupled receptors family 1 profile domain-containing protein n=1 Tax=Rotaria sordida TaxID=392033 RepID=A0A819D4T6_9BILA|nr:unnamed protein product [Rotaria sordida]
MAISETSLSRLIKFWILLIFQIPSILCSIFVLHHMFTSKTYRRTLANHVIIAMLIISLLSVTIDLSLTLNYLREGIVNPQSVSFCYFWMYIDYSLYASGMLLTTWASFERHILVFTLQYFRSSYKIIFVHYLPIIICLIYPFIFYIYTIYFYSCKNNILNFHIILCGSPCFKRESYILNWYDMLIHSVLPCTFIVTFSLALLIRVIKQKRRLQQKLFSWKKQRRMIIQLLSIACLYIIMNIPLFIIIFIQQCCLKTFAIAEHDLYLFYLYYFLLIFLPFVCLGSIDNLREKFKKFKYCFRENSRQVPIVNYQRTLYQQAMSMAVMK